MEYKEKLIAIPGIGPVRADDIMERFPTEESLIEAMSTDSDPETPPPMITGVKVLDDLVQEAFLGVPEGPDEAHEPMNISTPEELAESLGPIHAEVTEAQPMEGFGPPEGAIAAEETEDLPDDGQPEDPVVIEDDEPEDEDEAQADGGPEAPADLKPGFERPEGEKAPEERVTYIYRGVVAKNIVLPMCALHLVPNKPVTVPVSAEEEPLFKAFVRHHLLVKE
jgi:hypothetical protein